MTLRNLVLKILNMTETGKHFKIISVDASFLPTLLLQTILSLILKIWTSRGPSLLTFVTDDTGANSITTSYVLNYSGVPAYHFPCGGQGSVSLLRARP